MRLVTAWFNGSPFVGAEVGDEIVDLRAAVAQHLAARGEAHAEALAATLVPASMVAFIGAGPTAWRAAREALADVGSAGGVAPAVGGRRLRYRRDEVRVGAPLLDPEKIICIGRNYAEHARESGDEPPAEPIFFNKYNNAIVGPGDAVVHPGEQLTSKLDYEVELAVVIGRTGKDIPAERAMEYVFGYTVLNDISARDLQLEREGQQWIKGKTLDTFAPMGPAMVTADEIPDPHNLRIRLLLNGQVMQDSSTRYLIFNIPTLIAYLSQFVTLRPGDIISTGTPAGVGLGRRPPVWLKPGDVMVAEVEGIGSLVNPVVAR